MTAGGSRVEIKRDMECKNGIFKKETPNRN